MVAIVVSVAVSGITLLLTEFQGPDIVLISSPKFAVDYQKMIRRRKEHSRANLYSNVPTVLESEPVALIFANHGGKCGTILSIDLKFSPIQTFTSFYTSFSPTLVPSSDDLSPAPIKMPITIEPGDNTVFFALADVHTSNWKYKALYEVLQSSMNVDEILNSALEKSRESFQDFCNCLKENEMLGTISCDFSLTRGRFRTRIKTEKLFANVPLANNSDLAWAFFKESLENWEDLEPTRHNLLHMIAYPLKLLRDEFMENIRILEVQITDQNITQSSLKTDQWKSLRTRNYAYFDAPQWFLIRTESGLETELEELYQKIDRYNKSIANTRARTLLTTNVDLEKINVERALLLGEARTMENRLSRLYNYRINRQ